MCMILKQNTAFENYGYFALKDADIHKQIIELTKKIKELQISLNKCLWNY